MEAIEFSGWSSSERLTSMSIRIGEEKGFWLRIFEDGLFGAHDLFA